MGVLLGPETFDVSFTEQKRVSLPTELDSQLRQMIREV